MPQSADTDAFGGLSKVDCRPGNMRKVGKSHPEIRAKSTTVSAKWFFLKWSVLKWFFLRQIDSSQVVLS